MQRYITKCYNELFSFLKDVGFETSFIFVTKRYFSLQYKDSQIFMRLDKDPKQLWIDITFYSNSKIIKSFIPTLPSRAIEYAISNIFKPCWVDLGKVEEDLIELLESV